MVHPAAALLLLLLAAPLASCDAALPIKVDLQRQQPVALVPAAGASNDMCATCLLLVNETMDYLNSTQAKREVIDFIVNDVCPGLPGDLEVQCETLAAVLVPSAIKWVVDTFDPDTTCKDVGICPATATAGASLSSEDGAEASAGVGGGASALAQGLRSWQDLTCPVCELALQQALAVLTDPDLQSTIVKMGQDACVVVPSEQRDDCRGRVQKAADQLAAVLAEVDPRQACAQASACPPEGGKGSSGADPLREAVRRAVAGGALRARLSAAGAAVGGGFCEACQVAVMEVAAVIADPRAQAEAQHVAKAACSLTGNFTMQCSDYVDEYMPIAMNLALAYLKPELCRSAGACKKQPNSALQAEALLRQSALPLEAMQAS